MNKRQKKKFRKKNGYKLIKNAYMSLLISRVDDHCSDLCDGRNLICITTGKKNKEKPYIVSVKLRINEVIYKYSDGRYPAWDDKPR